MHTYQTGRPAVFDRIKLLHNQLNTFLFRLAPLADLILRVWVANIFFKSGLTKIQSFDTTIMLFSYEYSVPLLSPVLAAWLATGVELVIPVLLVIGLMTRYSAILLFGFNIVAAVSYPDISEAGIRDHVLWGLMLLVIMTHSENKLSVDYFISRKQE